MKTADAGQTDLVLSGIAVQIDSVYNRGTVVRGNLVDLRAVQQNGIQLQQMQAQVGPRFGPDSIEGGIYPHRS